MTLYCTRCGAANRGQDSRCIACGTVLLPVDGALVAADSAAQLHVPGPLDPAPYAPYPDVWSADQENLLPAVPQQAGLPSLDPSQEMLAGAFPRFGAFVFDLTIYAVLAVLVMTTSAVIGIADLGFFLALLLHPAYYVAFWATTGQTPGFRAARLQLVSEEGGRPTLGQCALRYGGMQISQWALYVGCLWMLWDARRQTWHDKMARTLVINT